MTSADLFAPFDLHGLKLPNRILMSAMTRTRATEDDVPTDLIREYYVQRASAGLIVTECTQVSDQGHGIIRAPGIHRADQIAAWRKVTDAVHAAGGHIYNQLWHCGRVAHPDMRGGEQPVAPSAIPATGEFFLPSGRVDFPIPRELGIKEIAPIVETFAQATRNAVKRDSTASSFTGRTGTRRTNRSYGYSTKRMFVLCVPPLYCCISPVQTVEAAEQKEPHDKCPIFLSRSY